MISAQFIELYSGSANITKSFESEGFSTISIDHNEALAPDICTDIMNISPEEISADIIWASPDCSKWSFASGSKNEFRKANEEELTEVALGAVKMIEHTLNLCKQAKHYWFLENPYHGALRMHDIMKPYSSRLISYCAYGVPHQKKTMIWGRFPPSWNPTSHCGHLRHPNIKMHKDAQARAIVPRMLAEQIKNACLRDDGKQIPSLFRDW
tara:strand:+ start:117 stop:746 length:630 start_codon:yes stop_codon:yes gene_type:complete